MTRFDGRAVRSAAIALALGLALTACSSTSYADPAGNERPAKVEAISGSTLKRITLLEKAANRIGVKTAPVTELLVDGQMLKSVPYSALLYDPAGKTWVYTNPEKLVFIRHEIKVLRIEKNQVILSEGPAIGTQVVTVAVAELYGAEVGIGK